MEPFPAPQLSVIASNAPSSQVTAWMLSGQVQFSEGGSQGPSAQRSTNAARDAGCPTPYCAQRQMACPLAEDGLSVEKAVDMVVQHVFHNKPLPVPSVPEPTQVPDSERMLHRLCAQLQHFAQPISVAASDVGTPMEQLPPKSGAATPVKKADASKAATPVKSQQAPPTQQLAAAPSAPAAPPANVDPNAPTKTPVKTPAQPAGAVPSSFVLVRTATAPMTAKAI
jgi:hypothetical protein